jgi:hypothetical protein
MEEMSFAVSKGTFNYILFMFLLFATVVTVSNAVSSTRLQTPIISSVTPNFGSIQGGSWVTIRGANFLSQGMFTNRAIFIGGQVCKEIPYYTTDNRMICVSPACVHPNCLSDENWQSSIQVSLDISVRDVETILSAKSTFTYHGGYTPSIYRVTKNVRGSTVGLLSGKITTDLYTDLTIKFGNNSAYIGDPGEINDYSISMWSQSANVYYIPPSDATGGFYNVTLESQDDQSAGSRGTGFARFFSQQRAFSNWGLPYDYSFDATLTGKVYSTSLNPVISSVSPSSGSIAGGTSVKITGSGFSKDMEKLTVFVAGYICDVKSSNFEEITCVTRSSDIAQNVNSISSLLVNPSQPNTFLSNNHALNSTREYGSPGWWIKMWDMSDFNSKRMRDSNVKVSVGWKGDSFTSFFYLLKTDWNTYFNYISNNWSPQSFASEMSTYLIAPIEGYYRFYMNADDDAFLYGTFMNKNTPVSRETLLLQTSFIGWGNIYGNLAKQMTRDIYLKRGQRYKLRAVVINYQGPDFFKLSLRVSPNETAASIDFSASDPTTDSYDKKFYNISSKVLTDPVFQHHHTLKTVQIINLSIFYQREVQVRSDFLLIVDCSNNFLVFS